MIGELLGRAHGTERMDEPDVPRSELARSLADLREVNRWLGGRRSLFRHLIPMIRRARAAAPLRVLDVAAGSGDLLIALAEWGRREGVALDLTATDHHPQTLALARSHTAGQPEIRVEPADALGLPYPDRGFHFAICSTALHHFDPAQAVRVLAELARVASHGVVVGDLRRSLSALWGARLLAATVWRRSPMTRHDGPLSVRRAYTPDELALLAQAAGLPTARVHAHLPFRVALVVDRTREAAA
ncbi:MAG: methyltransferase domain-containing protein [Gemmatimonadota bacterium]|nr:methyltransferase domain-containing protein [Gemmatimonadota bacterium]